MVKYLKGDILDAPAEALVNTVNTVGVMGRGIALQFKERFPANFKAYAAACKRDEVHPGRMFVFDTGSLTGPRFIINFPTKRHWRSNSRIEDIASGLDALVEQIQALQIRSIAIPPLGSGLGGLSWHRVKPLIEEAMARVPGVDVLVYEPAGAPAREARAVVNRPMTPSRAALAILMKQYLAALMDPAITLLEIHKLMYFLQAAGHPLRLRYVKGHYGPYAENLRHVLRDTEGQVTRGFRDDGDAPGTPLELVPSALREAETCLEDEEDVHRQLGRVGRLVDGYETPFGLELLATVHWVATAEHATDLGAVVAGTHRWGLRKHRFTPKQIEQAWTRLGEQGWLNPAPVAS